MLKRLFRPTTLSSRAAYARWDYPPHAHNPFMALEEATLRPLLPNLSGKRVLDLACGSGRWGNIALEQNAAQVISFDDSLPMLQRGQPSLPTVASMTAIPLPAASIDVIICGLAIGHSPDLDNILSEIARVLRPQGIALISDVHPFRAWMGAQRTFESKGRTFAIEHYIHRYADYVAALQTLPLNIVDVREASPQANEPPAVLVIKLERA